jgi:hypothetical protein
MRFKTPKACGWCDGVQEGKVDEALGSGERRRGEDRDEPRLEFNIERGGRERSGIGGERAEGSFERGCLKIDDRFAHRLGPESRALAAPPSIDSQIGNE